VGRMGCCLGHCLALAMRLHNAAGIGAIMVPVRPLRHRRSPAAVVRGTARVSPDFSPSWLIIPEWNLENPTNR
jgi:hypothetical protein